MAGVPAPTPPGNVPNASSTLSPSSSTASSVALTVKLAVVVPAAKLTLCGTVQSCSAAPRRPVGKSGIVTACSTASLKVTVTVAAVPPSAAS